MKDKHSCGFWYENEDELKYLLGVEEYLDVVNDKTNSEWISDMTGCEENESVFQTTMGMEVIVRRKADGLSQKELAKKLGIAVETLSKIENGHENLSGKVKAKIDSFLNGEELSKNHFSFLY